MGWELIYGWVLFQLKKMIVCHFLEDESGREQWIHQQQTSWSKLALYLLKIERERAMLNLFLILKYQKQKDLLIANHDNIILLYIFKLSHRQQYIFSLLFMSYHILRRKKKDKNNRVTVYHNLNEFILQQ